MRICEQFEKSLSVKDNTDFLKKEYGIGGSSHIPGFDEYNQWHDSKGIRISKGYQDNSPFVSLSWHQVEKRLSQLIRDGRYLNDNEKEAYEKWLEEKHTPRFESEVTNALPEQEIQYKYEFLVGDKVYMGTVEYEISSIDDKRVMLYDVKMPLLSKELERAVFEERVRENPLNDHLRVVETEPSNAVSDEELIGKEVSINDRKHIIESVGKISGDVSMRDITFENSTGFPINRVEKIDFVRSLIKEPEDTHPFFDEEDRYFNRPDVQEFEAVYFHPHPEYGGQFVILRLTYQLINEAKERTDSAEEFFSYLDSVARTELIDKGDEGYEEFMEELLTREPIAVGRTEETINILLEKAGVQEIKNDTLNKAKELIDGYIDDEFETDKGGDYSDLTEIGLAYTTTEDGKHEIQVNADIVNNRIETFVDNVPVRTEQYESLEELNEKVLPHLSFDELTYVTEEDIEKATQPKEKVIKGKVTTYDLHPDIPMSERHNFNLKENDIEVVGKRERFERNIKAIEVLKRCEAEDRFAKPEEQIILSKYVGWGGLPEAFDPNNSSWAGERMRMYELLTQDEYISARESTLTAFYTPPEVIAAMYQVLENLGFKRGNILEPSCGIGHFMGMLPESMAESKIYGVELDSVSARIAKQLYQKNSIANDGFENVNLPDSFFDAVIGNVPFGDFKVYDKRYDKNNFLIHDFFFAKSLDKLRPVGVMALITSKGTMDKQNHSVRKYIAQRAELLGAIRLPNNAFSGNAGTEVVSDILFLQKRDTLIADPKDDWIYLADDENGITMNSYFADNPQMILGEMKEVSGRFGMETTCVPYENVLLSDLLHEAVQNIHGHIEEYEIDDIDEMEKDTSIPADLSVRNYSYTVVEDKIYFRENSRMNLIEVSDTGKNRIMGMIKIRDAVREVIDLQLNDYPDSAIKVVQRRLNTLYDSFTKKYGLLSSRANNMAFSQDSSYPLISALEVLEKDGTLKRKADIFTKRTIKPHIEITHVETSSEALAVSIGEKACVDMEYMMTLSGKSEEEIYSDLNGVIFLNPLYEEGSDEQKYLPADEYLSGNVREKLRFVRTMEELHPGVYSSNVKALEKAQPEELNASEISVKLGSTWIPEDIISQFVYEFLDTPFYLQKEMTVRYSDVTGEWYIKGKNYDGRNVKANTTYGTKRVNAYKIIEDTLNLKDVRIFDYFEDENGKKKAVLNKNETSIAQAKQQEIKDAFVEWIWDEHTRRERLVKLYNEKFNSIRPREYDGSHVIFHGMNPEIELRTHQKNAVARILYGGNTLLAHVVGSGKTFTMVTASQELKRLGLCNKSLFVVPNHLTEQWAAEYLTLYPGANILVATKKDFEMKNRRKFCSRIATGEYDAVIIGHSQFEKLPVSYERQRDILTDELNEVLTSLDQLKRSKGEQFTIKQLERTRKSIEGKLKKLNDQSRKDNVITFEELGIDRLFVDESHSFKNLFCYSKMRNVSGISQTEAQKSSDMFMKCRYLDEITGGKGIIFATGTPISNTMVEAYTIQRYLQYETLQHSGLGSFDAWASTFGETVTTIELNPEGTGYGAKTCFAKFYNLPELMNMFREVADIQTSDMLELPVPNANYHTIAVKPSEVQKKLVESLSERADAVRNGQVDSSKDNMLLITNDGRKLALDQRLINESLPDHEGSKVNACVDNVYRIWKETSDKKSTQIVFCDLSTPKNDGTFSVYDDMKHKLIEKGIPEEEVKFIHDANTEAKKEELFQKVRDGDVRVLFGSTQRMGAGTNIQDKLIAIHDIDCPWRPSDLEQRAGRIVRQGNENDEVHIYRYVTEQTFDAYLYQMVERKQKFVSQIMSSCSPVRTMEDIDETALSYAEIKALASGNPKIKEKMDLDMQVQKLRVLKANFLNEKHSLEDRIIKFYPEDIRRRSEKIGLLKEDWNTVESHPGKANDEFVGMIIRGTKFTQRKDAGEAILSLCKQYKGAGSVDVGEYRGFKTSLIFNTFNQSFDFVMKGKTEHAVSIGDDAVGTVIRIDNELEFIKKHIQMEEEALADVKNQLETAKVDVKRTFAYEDELTDKTARLNELNIELNLDKRESEISPMSAEEEEFTPDKKRNRDYER
ncbi:MAG: DEAD/DEAH box helicase family protein [Ruminococcus sp.]|nr:DEAD/DEAH box helicase family protein [Ruminococcus sp.]